MALINMTLQVFLSLANCNIYCRKVKLSDDHHDHHHKLVRDEDGDYYGHDDEREEKEDDTDDNNKKGRLETWVCTVI